MERAARRAPPPFGATFQQEPPCICNEHAMLQLRAMRDEVGRAPRDGWGAYVAHRDPTRPLAREYGALNRAFFKCAELLVAARVADPGTIALLCEAPGGFAQTCRRRWPAARIQAFSYSGPGAIRFAPAVADVAARGLPCDGDITSADAARHIERALGGRVDLVTADGGVHQEDASIEEQNSVRLLVAQVATALRLQRQGGTLVVKMFECSTRATLDVVRVLRAVYDDVRMVKPTSSRATNSERYACCVGFDAERAAPFADGLAAVASRLRGGGYALALLQSPPSPEEMVEPALLCAMQSAAIRDALATIEAADWGRARRARDADVAELRAIVDRFFHAAPRARARPR